MSTDYSTTAPSLEELEACVAFLRRGLLESERRTTRSERRRIQLCPYCTILCGTVMARANRPAPKGFPKHLFLSTCQAFLVDAMCVLTTLPTARDERKLCLDVRRAYNIHRNTCNHPDGLDDESLSYQFIMSLATMVSICLQSSKTQVTLHASIRFRTNGAWPASISDILPGDSPRSALSNYLRCWSRHSQGTVHTVLPSLLHLGSIPNDIAAALMDTRHEFLLAYFERLTTLGREIRSLSADSPHIGEAQSTLFNFFTLGGIIQKVLTAAKISPHEFVVSYESQLDAAFEEAARAATLFSELALTLCAMIRLGFIANQRAPRMSNQNVADFLALNADPLLYGPKEDAYTRFYHVASPSSREGRCWAPGCQRYGEAERSKLMRCARCRTVQYCSRECQRAHWKDVKSPHKVVCAALARIHDVYPFSTGNMDPQAFSQACRVANIQVEDLVMPFRYLTSSDTIQERSDAEELAIARKWLDAPPRLTARA